jgi:hypothetical protein
MLDAGFVAVVLEGVRRHARRGGRACRLSGAQGRSRCTATRITALRVSIEPPEAEN